MLYRRLLSTVQAERKKREQKLMRAVSDAAPKVIPDVKVLWSWTAWVGGGDTYSNYGCLFSASLWPSPLCRVLSKKKQKNHKNTRINKSRRRMNGLAMHTDLETERQQIQRATEGPVRRRTISRFEGSSAPGSEWGVSVQRVYTTDINLTSLHTRWPRFIPLQHVWSSL